LAKAAELNNYPGPAHVLELASELHLTAERAATNALFRSMQAKATALRQEIVRHERELRGCGVQSPSSDNEHHH